jgi:hypothetical protein
MTRRVHNVCGRRPDNDVRALVAPFARAYRCGCRKFEGSAGQSLGFASPEPCHRKPKAGRLATMPTKPNSTEKASAKWLGTPTSPSDKCVSRTMSADDCPALDLALGINAQ